MFAVAIKLQFAWLCVGLCRQIVVAIVALSVTSVLYTQSTRRCTVYFCFMASLSWLSKFSLGQLKLNRLE